MTPLTKSKTEKKSRKKPNIKVLGFSSVRKRILCKVKKCKVKKCK